MVVYSVESIQKYLSLINSYTISQKTVKYHLETLVNEFSGGFRFRLDRIRNGRQATMFVICILNIVKFYSFIRFYLTLTFIEFDIFTFKSLSIKTKAVKKLDHHQSNRYILNVTVWRGH